MDSSSSEPAQANSPGYTERIINLPAQEVQAPPRQDRVQTRRYDRDERDDRGRYNRDTRPPGRDNRRGDDRYNRDARSPRDNRRRDRDNRDNRDNRDSRNESDRRATPRDTQTTRARGKRDDRDTDEDLYVPKRSSRLGRKGKSGRQYVSDAPMLYTDDTSEPLPSLLARYNDVPEYPEGAFHPRDFDYHAAESCGPKGDKSLDEAFRDNGIRCEFADYANFSPSNRATRKDLERLTRARKKSCRCEVERRLTNEHLVTKGQGVDGEHIWPLNKAALLCKQCAQMEREMYKYGYLKNRTEIEKHDSVTNLLTVVHDLLEGPDSVWQASPGSTAVEKIAKHVWDEVLPRNVVLKNIKRQLPFNSFVSAISTVADFLTEKQITSRLRKLRTKKKYARSRVNRLTKRHQRLTYKESLLKGLKGVAHRRRKMLKSGGRRMSKRKSKQS